MAGGVHPAFHDHDCVGIAHRDVFACGVVRFNPDFIENGKARGSVRAIVRELGAQFFGADSSCLAQIGIERQRVHALRGACFIYEFQNRLGRHRMRTE